MKREAIPEPALQRLALLYRFLKTLPESIGTPVSSGKLAELMGIPAHTIRKDISFLGEEAGMGAGYEPRTLSALIAKKLRLDRQQKACVAGLGRLGSAILYYGGFAGSEFSLAAGFDTSMNRIELLRTSVPLYPASELERVIRDEGIELGIIAVPEKAAQNIADRMVNAGIRGMINFAPVVLRCDKRGVFIRDISVLGEMTVLQAMMSLED